jgi:L-histidine N-alpha-methyltransferase
MNPTTTRTSAGGRIVIHRHPSLVDPAADLREIRDGLLGSPREISSRFFYDERGGELFDRICETPEYYPFRTEMEILRREAPRIVRITGAGALVELGSGASTKTRILLDAMERAGKLKQYVPMDVNEALVQKVAEDLVREYEGIHIEGHIGDFQAGLHHLPLGEGRLVAFLGGTIGNFSRPAAREFLREIAGNLDFGDYLLLGTDLVKDMDRLEEAYNDSQGLTAEFSKNSLRVVNELAGADFDPDAFAHRAFWNPEKSWIEMRLVAARGQRVRLDRLGMEIYLPQADDIRTEISAKYTRSTAEDLLNDTGFELVQWLTDEESLFALSLARRAVVS